MNKKKFFLMCVGSGIFLVMNVYAQNSNSSHYALMTAGDMQNNALSNISITNRANQSVAVSGLYIASFDINDCSACFGGVVSGDNLGGAVLSPVTFKRDQTIPIGQNYLYNMIYNGIYYIKNTIGSTPCSLPGCSWSGDDPHVQGWCVSMNVISRNSNYTASSYASGSNPPANSPPYAAAGTSSPYQYKYDLINPNTLGTGSACLGPIVCNDKTLTCKVNTSQNLAFQVYS